MHAPHPSGKIRSGADNPITWQLMWQRLIAVVEEQAQALVRTAFSTSVREAGDLSAGVYDASGRMLAQAVTGTPGHVNAMADAVPHFIRLIGRETMQAGDAYITNDPWLGTGHLHDFTVCSPVFAPDDETRLIGFFACTAHVVDIGGRGFGADGQSLYEEGLQIPIMPFLKAGQVDKTLLALLCANVREPQQVSGDLFALATCNDIGKRRLADMLAEFQQADLQGVADYIIQTSEAGTRALIRDLPQISAQNSMWIDGFATPIKLQIKLSVDGDSITLDYAGSSGQDPKGINVPLVYTKAYSCYALKCALAPDIPNNAGSLAPFQITAPEGSIVNAQRPAPVALRHVIGHMLPDVVFGALDQVLPHVVPAEGASALCNFQVSLTPSEGQKGVSAEVLMFNAGGMGARPTLDGLNATAFPSGVMTMPVEATEQAGPVVIWRKELRPGSGGAGQYRGGLGQSMEVAPRPGYTMQFSAMFDRVQHPARGRQGGEDGAPTRIRLSTGEALAGKGKQDIPSGARVCLDFPGGGGYGPADMRDPKLVARDQRRGYL